MPKDKQLRQEAGINETGVIKFLECVMTCLDLIMDANCSINEVPIFNYDHVCAIQLFFRNKFEETCIFFKFSHLVLERFKY